MKQSPKLAIGLALTLLAGCQAYPGPGGPAALGEATRPAVGVAGAPAVQAARALRVQVRFPAGGERKLAQAMEQELRRRAVVTLRDVYEGRPVAAGTTDDDGRLTLTPSAAFAPQVGEVFVLEAVRAVGRSDGNRGYELLRGFDPDAPPYEPAGDVSLRMRTRVQWTSQGWRSTYDGEDGVVINSLTTAIALLPVLKRDGDALDPEYGIGVVHAYEGEEDEQDGGDVKLALKASIPVESEGPSDLPAYIDGAAFEEGAFAPLYQDWEVYLLAYEIRDHLRFAIDPVQNVTSIRPVIDYIDGDDQPFAGSVAVIEGFGFNVLGGRGMGLTVGGRYAPIIAVTPTRIFFEIPDVPRGTQPVAIYTRAQADPVATSSMNVVAQLALAGLASEIGSRKEVVLEVDGLDENALHEVPQEYFASLRVDFGGQLVQPHDWEDLDDGYGHVLLKAWAPEEVRGPIALLAPGVRSNRLDLRVAYQDTNSGYEDEAMTSATWGPSFIGRGPFSLEGITGESVTATNGQVLAADLTCDSLTIPTGATVHVPAGANIRVRGDFVIYPDSNLVCDLADDGDMGTYTLTVGGTFQVHAGVTLSANGPEGFLAEYPARNGGNLVVKAAKYDIAYNADITAKGGLHQDGGENGQDGTITLFGYTVPQDLVPRFDPMPETPAHDDATDQVAVSTWYQMFYGAPGTAGATIYGVEPVEAEDNEGELTLTYALSNTDQDASPVWKEAGELYQARASFVRFRAGLHVDDAGATAPTLQGVRFYYVPDPSFAFGPKRR